MRTSIKLFLGSIGLLGVGLLVYDLQLNAAFQKGDYTQPFYNYERLPFSKFNRIRLNSATALSIVLVKGDFKVLANPRLGDLVQVRQEDSQLVITAHFPYRFDGGPIDYALFISCPDLKELETTGQYYLRNQLVEGSYPAGPWHKGTIIRGFRQDSLHLSAVNSGAFALEDDRIGMLRAMIGAGSALTIGRGNAIGGGDITVLSNAQLTLTDTGNLNVNHYLADSATLTLSGAAAKQLLKLKEP